MLGSLFRSERRAIQATSWGAWPGDSSGPAWAGVEVDTKSSLQLLTVYGCNRFICDGIATLPLDELRDSAEGSKSVPKARWLEEPVPDLDPIAWLTQNLSSLLLAGDDFLFLDYTDRGLETLLPLDPSGVRVFRNRGRKVYGIGSEEFDSKRILHIPAVMFPGHDRGMSPVEAARQTIGAGMAVKEFAARFFGQGAVMSGVIEDPAPADANKARETARIFGRLHNGKDKAHLPGVLMGGAVWKSTGVTNEQAQFLETQGFTASEICGQMFMLDPTEMGLPALPGSNLTYANLEQRNSRKVQVTFLPWIIRLEKALSALLPAPRYIKFNVGGLLRGDMLTRYQAHAIAIQNEFETPNEARSYEDMPPLPGGDVVVKKSTAPDPVATPAK
jgi:HK97 family phage portal protein